MTIAEYFSQYQDKNGFIQPTIGGGSYNGLLYSSLAAIVLKDNNALNYNILSSFTKVVHACNKAGVLQRTPEGVGGLEGQDDYVGVCAAAGAVPECSLWSGGILWWGSKNWWNYNSDNRSQWTLRTWFMRYPHLIAHIHYGTRIVPNAIYRFFWALAVVWASFASKDNVDAWMLTWCLIRAFEGNKSPSFIGRLAVNVWDKMLYWRFGEGGLRNLAYLGAPGEHPLTRYWLRKKESIT